MYNYEDLIIKYFHGKENFNCAQTVLKILSEQCNSFNIKDDDIKNASAFGGGRAEKGYCGALYGALSVLKSDAEKEKLINNFKSQIGNLTCRDIKTQNKKACKDCILCALKSITHD